MVVSSDQLHHCLRITRQAAILAGNFSPNDALVLRFTHVAIPALSKENLGYDVVMVSPTAQYCTNSDHQHVVEDSIKINMYGFGVSLPPVTNWIYNIGVDLSNDLARCFHRTNSLNSFVYLHGTFLEFYRLLTKFGLVQYMLGLTTPAETKQIIQA